MKEVIYLTSQDYFFQGRRSGLPGSVAMQWDVVVYVGKLREVSQV